MSQQQAQQYIIRVQGQELTGRAAAIAYLVARHAEQINAFEVGTVTFACAHKKVVLTVTESHPVLHLEGVN